MNKQTRTILFTVIGLVISILYLAFSFRYRKELGWWAFIEPFALFMSTFTELMALIIGRMIPSAAKTLQIISFVLGGIFCVAIVVECVLLYIN